MLYYKLNNNRVQQPLVFADIQKLIQTVPDTEKDNTVLVVKLEKIIDYAGDNPLPKITYEGDSPT